MNEVLSIFWTSLEFSQGRTSSEWFGKAGIFVDANPLLRSGREPHTNRDVESSNFRCYLLVEGRVMFKSCVIWNGTNKRTKRKLEFRTSLLSEVINLSTSLSLWPQRNLSCHCRRSRGSPACKFQTSVGDTVEKLLRSPRFLGNFWLGYSLPFVSKNCLSDNPYEESTCFKKRIQETHRLEVRFCSQLYIYILKYLYLFMVRSIRPFSTSPDVGSSAIVLGLMILAQALSLEVTGRRRK